jgi:hypothetical protein
MAVAVPQPLLDATAASPEPSEICPSELTSPAMLDVLQTCLHSRPSEWIFLRELRVGTGFRNSSSAQRLDAFALNCFVHNSMKRICYEVKMSRADFLCEMKHPLKRRTGLRYSNEFYFITPRGLLNASEIPIECGLIEVASAGDPDFKTVLPDPGALAHLDESHKLYCRVVVPAPWRETPPPTWQFVAAMLRNQRRMLNEQPPKPPNQQRLPFVD